MDSSDFEQVIRYRCKWCGQIFISNSRHECKYAISKKSCFSCKHCQGVMERVEQRKRPSYLSEEHEIEEYTVKSFRCSKCEDGGPDLPILSHNKWNLQCPDYEMMDDYTGKETYLKQVVYKNIWRMIDEEYTEDFTVY